MRAGARRGGWVSFLQMTSPFSLVNTEPWKAPCNVLRNDRAIIPSLRLFFKGEEKRDCYKTSAVEYV